MQRLPQRFWALWRKLNGNLTYTYSIFKRYFSAPLPVAALWKPAAGAAGAAARVARGGAAREGAGGKGGQIAPASLEFGPEVVHITAVRIAQCLGQVLIGDQRPAVASVQAAQHDHRPTAGAPGIGKCKPPLADFGGRENAKSLYVIIQ